MFHYLAFPSVYGVHRRHDVGAGGQMPGNRELAEPAGFLFVLCCHVHGDCIHPLLTSFPYHLLGAGAAAKIKRRARSAADPDPFPSLCRYRCSTGTKVRSFGPTYSARGRMSRLSANCSNTWAVQPDTRLNAKIGVNKSVGMPSK